LRQENPFALLGEQNMRRDVIRRQNREIAFLMQRAEAQFIHVEIQRPLHIRHNEVGIADMGRGGQLIVVHRLITPYILQTE
jgi:hypothetical protein